MVFDSLTMLSGMVALKNRLCRFSGKHGNHTTDVVDESHVEHGVRLIQDQKFNPFQRQQALVAQVEQATGRGHKNVGALAELSHLSVLADPAKINAVRTLTFLA